MTVRNISRRPSPSPRVSTDVRSLARSLVRWHHNQIFWAWWVTNFSYPWCFAGALRVLKLRYNKLLTNLASSSRTREYWSSVVFVPTSLRSVRPSHSASKRLLILPFSSSRGRTFWNALLKLINCSGSSYPTRASYSGQVDGLRNPMKNEFKLTRPISNTVDKTRKTQHITINNFTVTLFNNTFYNVNFQPKLFNPHVNYNGIVI